jgi:endonuclease/exonuclease/phosphatase family metal-dependent hydrolase
MTAAPSESSSNIEYGNQVVASPAVDINSRATLVLASYNIRYAVGRFLIASGLGRKAGLNVPLNRPRAVQRNIEIAAKAFSENVLLPCPDILTLQEADKRTRRAGQQHVAAELAQQLNLPYVHAAVGIPRGVPPKKREWWLNFEEQIALHDPGDTGVALLSRIPLADVARIDLPWHDCPWRPRLAMAATVLWRGRHLRLFNVHIDPHGPLGNQYRQIETVLARAREHDGPTVILGDFNSLSKQKAIEIRKLMETHEYATPFETGTATWRGAGLRFHADWIFGRSVVFHRHGVAKPLNVSDHWPIWAEVEL